jgi:hypothetical protein
MPKKETVVKVVKIVPRIKLSEQMKKDPKYSYLPRSKIADPKQKLIIFWVTVLMNIIFISIIIGGLVFLQLQNNNTIE